MKSVRMLFIFGLILSLLLFSAPVMAASQGRNEAFAAARILVKFKAGTLNSEKSWIHRVHGASVVDVIEPLGVQVLKIPAGRVQEKVQAYMRENAVEYAEPDYTAYAFNVPNDPSFSEQWGMTKIQAPDAWNISQGETVKIAILDTGVDQDHPDLAAKLIKNDQNNKDFTGSGSPDDFYGHGTHCAGIAAAVTANGTGVAGVACQAMIMNGKVLDNSGSGAYSWIASGIIWAADNGAKVISLSLGGFFGSTTMKNAVNYAWNKGVVVVAAAGNDGYSLPSYPAYYANCIAVAASNADDGKASFSNYGSWVDVAAPGLNIFSTVPNHANTISSDYLGGQLEYGVLSGTSMAAPHVAGLAALVWATSYGTTNTNVRNRIESTADTSGTIWTSYAIERINAYEAVRSATPPPPVISAVQATPDSATATITWTTDEASDSLVEYGLAATYGSSVSGAAAVTAHSITLSGLQAGTTYHYRVMSRDGSGNTATSGDFTFTTLSVNPGTLIISNVHAINITKNTATITWDTNLMTTSAVSYWNASGVINLPTDLSLVTVHTIQLSGLKANSLYSYQVSSVTGDQTQAAYSDILKFKTPKR